MACKTNSGQDILDIVEILQKDTDLLRRFVQGEANEDVPLGEPVATPTPTLRHLAKNVLDAIDYFRSQIGEVLDPVRLDSYAFNVRRSRILPDDVVAGSVVTLPVTYYPGRDILLVTYRGQVCTPRKQDDWNPGERQYEEIVSPDVPVGGNASNFPSDKILVSFDMDAGSNLDCWVVASNLMKEMATLLHARDVAVAASLVATEQATIATEERETIQAMIGDAVLELGVANIDYSFRADKDYAAGEAMTLPINYYPRRAVLVVVYKGQVCTPYKLGQSNNYSYREVGTDPTVEVNQIIVEFDVKQGDPFYVLVWASSTGRNIELISALASDMKIASSNAMLAVQSVYNKADKYYATSNITNLATLRNQILFDTITHLDFTNAGLPGGSVYSGRIDFDNGTYLSLDVDENGQDRFSLKDAGDNVIKLFYAQQSGWMASGIWAFPAPVMITAELSPEVPAGPCVWDAVLAMSGVALTVDPQYNYLNKPQRSELQSVVTDAAYNYNDTSVYVTMDMYNALTKQPSQQQRTFPVASIANAGAMPAEAYSALMQALVDIQSLKNAGGKYIGQSFPTHAALMAWTIPPSVNIDDFTFVEADETKNGAITRYACVDDGSGGKTFAFMFVMESSPIGLASALSPGLVLGTIGDGPAGKIFVELDGSMSVLGWDVVKTDIANNRSDVDDILERIQDLGGTVNIRPDPPLNLSAIWLNTTDHCFYYYNGAQWVRTTGVYKENAGMGSEEDPGGAFDLDIATSTTPGLILSGTTDSPDGTIVVDPDTGLASVLGGAGGGDGIPLLSFCEAFHVLPGHMDLSLDHGLLQRQGTVPSYAQAFAQLEAWIADGFTGYHEFDANWVNEYNANGGFCGKFSLGNGIDTWRLPRIKNRVSVGFTDADAGLVPGQFIPDQMRPITGSQNTFSFAGAGTSGSGSFNISQNVQANVAGGATGYYFYASNFDSSRLGARYAGGITHGPLLILRPLLKMFSAEGIKIDPIVDSYSLVEYDTGRKWIDGRPIYRKTFNCGGAPSTPNSNIFETVISLGIPNFDACIDIRGTCWGNTASLSRLSIPYVQGATFLVAYVDNGVLRVRCSNNWSATHTNCYVTMDYVKV